MTTPETSNKIIELCALVGVDTPKRNFAVGTITHPDGSFEGGEYLTFTTDTMLAWEGWGGIIRVVQHLDKTVEATLFIKRKTIENTKRHYSQGVNEALVSDPAEALGLLLIARLEEMKKEKEDGNRI